MEKKVKDIVIILGAAGRDFHDFNVHWKKRQDCRVACFTATQIPGIHGRRYPPELAGPDYPEGIPIYLQDDLPQLIHKFKATICTLAYSDIAFNDVMDLASVCATAGARFVVLPPEWTMLKSCKPIIAVTAVRTGCGKSQTTRYVVESLHRLTPAREKKLNIAIVRHPMPYGNLVKQRCQRFTTLSDLDKHECTIEEREEYEQHIEAGYIVYAGVDYEMILRECEKEADIIIWDGGNNDTPFYRPDLHFTVADALRPGHELTYYRGLDNLRLCDYVILNKVNTAQPEAVALVKKNIAGVRPDVAVIDCDSLMQADVPGRQGKDADAYAESLIKGKRVLAVDDGPTLTHGGMPFGAAHAYANAMGARLIDPRPHAVGSLRDSFMKYTHLKNDLPAMGYSSKQLSDLKATIDNACKSDADAIVIGTPISLTSLIKINKPNFRVRYFLSPKDPKAIVTVLDKFLVKLNGKQTSKKLSSKL